MLRVAFLPNNGQDAANNTVFYPNYSRKGYNRQLTNRTVMYYRKKMVCKPKTKRVVMVDLL